MQVDRVKTERSRIGQPCADLPAAVGKVPPADPGDGVDRPLIELIATKEGLAALEPEWRRLESQMIELPFVSFDWLVPWWQHLSTQKNRVRDEMFVCTFRSSSGELLGIAPLMITHRPNMGPLRFRRLQFFGADPNITEIRCIAAAPEHMSLLYTTLLDYLRKSPGKWDSVHLTGLPGSTEPEKTINQQIATTYWSNDLVNPILELKPTWEQFRAGLPRNIRESLRKCRNAPKRDGLSFEFHVVSDSGDIDLALHTFFELHRARSKMPSALGHMDYFASIRSQRFLADVCNRFANRGLLRIFELKHNDSVIATRIGFVLGDTLYLYYSGYDPQYQKYSVMTTVVAESVKYAITEGFRFVNLSTGRDVSKTRWSPREVNFRRVEFPAQSRIHTLKYLGYRALVHCFRQGSTVIWFARPFSRRFN